MDKENVEGPLELLRIAFMPERKLPGLLVVAANKPKVIYELPSFLIRHNMKLLYANIVARNDEAELTVFLDISESENMPEEIAEEIAKTENVKNVHVIKPFSRG